MALSFKLVWQNYSLKFLPMVLMDGKIFA